LDSASSVPAGGHTRAIALGSNATMSPGPTRSSVVVATCAPVLNSIDTGSDTRAGPGSLSATLICAAAPRWSHETKR